MEKRNIISAYLSLDNARQNMRMKSFAKEVLLEENYEKFIKSYKFMFWFPISMLIPQGRIYRKFSKWFRKEHASISELDIIFYEE